MASIRDRLLDYSKEYDGLITTAAAKSLGIPVVELRKLAHRGKLTRVGRGVYRTAASRFEPKSAYREALALVGPEAFLVGESALAVHQIGVFNPRTYQIATTQRVRKKLPKQISLQRVKDITGYDVVEFDHVRSQSVYAALKELFWITEAERIHDAIEDGLNRNYISARQAAELTKMIRDRDQAKLNPQHHQV